MRRVPKDIANSFPLRRVQRSLRTKDRATAYAAGARVHAAIEAQFAAARRSKRATLDLVPTDDWTMRDWSMLDYCDWLGPARCGPGATTGLSFGITQSRVAAGRPNA